MIIILNVISSFFDLFIIYIFFNELFTNRKQEIPKHLFFLCFIVVEFILMANTYINPGSLSVKNKIITITISIVTTFTLCLLYNASLKQRILATITFQLIAALGEAILTLLLYLVSPSILDTDTIFVNCFMETMSKLFMFILVLLFITFWRKNIHIQNNKYNVLVLSTPIISIIIGLIIPTDSIPSYDTKSFYYVLLICLSTLNIINFYLLKDLIKVYELQRKNIQLELSINYQTEKYRQLNTSYRDTRRIVHDMKKHYNTIEKLVMSDKKEALAEYLNSSIRDIESTYTKYNTGNLVIDTLLYNYDNLAESLHIPFNVCLNVDSNKVPINDYDLCVILGNLLDNAVDACGKLPSSDVWINVSIQTTENHVLIKTENKIPDKSIKSQRYLLHGFGTENIRRTCNKYYGLYDIIKENDIYTASIAIPIIKQTTNGIRYVSVIEQQS